MRSDWPPFAGLNSLRSLGVLCVSAVILEASVLGPQTEALKIIAVPFRVRWRLGEISLIAEDAEPQRTLRFLKFLVLRGRDLSIRAWRHTSHAFEYSREVTLIREAGGEGDSRQIIFGHC